MAGGGTGGHVLPSIAVARELRRRGHEAVFFGTRAGMEARLVPAAGFGIEWIEISGLNRVGWKQAASTLGKLPGSTWRCRALLRKLGACGIFSMGGYVAGPVMLAGPATGTPMILMEPNAMPGWVSRAMGNAVRRALVSFEEAQKFFPPGRSEITGLPVRPEFFEIGAKPPGDVFTVLITGGSRGARALNRAARESWKHFAGLPVRLILQTGATEHEELAKVFESAGIDGEVVPFIPEMAKAYMEADLVVSRAGAGAVAELAASGKPSLLVPFPFAADDHQKYNALAMQNAGAARMITDKDLNGDTLFEGIDALRRNPETLEAMGRAARVLGRRGAAERAADLLEQFASERK